ncbi:MAG: phenylalanine--tRNA ligase subunit beta [Candidatus Dojkabacteria bacterium]|nr:phenylalanine--tRNA ligase subunit beta [Candidatus Dojkabacteria bacterium]
MLISYNWLKQYLPNDFEISDEEFQKKITSCLAEVEQLTLFGAGLKNVVVGEIKELKTHPNSDKLQVAIVDVGSARKRTIVCAATNLYEEAKVPVALPGGTVLNPNEELGEQGIFEIHETEINGVRSSGMLCSQKELGLTENHEGIWILPEETKVGDDLTRIINDKVIEIENKSLTHRPDCFSHLGIARETAAIFKTKLQYHLVDEPLIPTKTLPLVVKVENQEFCKRYTAIAIHGVKVKESPLWLQLRLLSTGIRPINNIVDATNYVMLDLGQPLHAFDYNKLSAPRIIVRTAKRGEKITTLDGEERELGEKNLLICDPDKAIGIAGIMGGVNSEIDENTKDIVLESANFEMYNNRRSSKELGLRTDAVTRFEKGQDPNLTLPALQKAVELILEISGGEIACEVIDMYAEPEKERSIDFDISSVQKLLGIEPSKEEVISILESLELKVKRAEASATNIEVEVPTFRHDLAIKEDLIEEVGRIYGYDKFIPTLPQRDLDTPFVDDMLSFQRIAKTALSALGFDEIYTYSFTGETQYQNTLLDISQCMKIINPISPDLNYLRNSLVPGLLEKVKPNLGYFDKFSYFELARIYTKELNSEGIPVQPRNICGLICENLEEDKMFFKIKAAIETFLDKLMFEGVKFLKSKDKAYLHPKQQGEIKVENEIIGHLGNVHPEVLSNWNIKKNTSIFVLDFEKLFNLRQTQVKYVPISKYPIVTRDLSILVDKKTKAADLLECLSKTESKYLQNVEIIDVFDKGEQKSITIKVTLQSKNKTLGDKDIKNDIEAMTKAIAKIKGTIRS